MVRTRIRQVARQRGFTAREVARGVKCYPSNLSAMDAGRRPVSLRTLARIARWLGCSVGDLVEDSWGSERPVYRRRALTNRLATREEAALDGTDRAWVHAAMLAWQRHAGFRRTTR